MRNSLDRQFDNFDRKFNRTFGAVLFIWALGVVATLVALGVGIWAVVTLVNHFTGA